MTCQQQVVVGSGGLRFEIIVSHLTHEIWEDTNVHTIACVLALIIISFLNF